jgi:hypothetical protein
VQGRAEKINLVAVQARPELADYASAEAFHAKMAALAKPRPLYRRYPLPPTRKTSSLPHFCPLPLRGRPRAAALRQALLKVLSRRLPSFLGAM